MCDCVCVQYSHTQTYKKLTREEKNKIYRNMHLHQL